MLWSAEEYLQQAAECEEKAKAADKEDISNCFRKLAEYWRALAKIAANKSAESRVDRR